MPFFAAFTKELLANIRNNYADNFDFYRFDGEHARKASSKKGLSQLRSHIGFFRRLYPLLSDHQSKDLLVKLLAYRTLGYKRVKLPLNNKYFWEKIKEIDRIAERHDYIPVASKNWNLYRFSLNRIGVPLDLYCTTMGVYVDFIIKQYEYHSHDSEIMAKEGDVIIDAGGCWGDTALYFANAVGEGGRVYSFEFIPSNLEIMKKNIDLNDTIKNSIYIVERPLWSESDKIMNYRDRGPGSSMSFTESDLNAGKVATLTIDDFVERNNIQKIDLIKMDIEGAELAALKGAEKTLRRCMPKLAIAVYHQPSDFYTIPHFIASLELGYKLYLGHYTIHTEETVLFATAQVQTDYSYSKIMNKEELVQQKDKSCIELFITSSAVENSTWFKTISDLFGGIFL